jgi:signal transduction histidine kinase
VLTCVIVGFAALIAAAAVTGWTVLQGEQHTRWVEHTYRVERSIADVRILIERLEASRRGVLLSGSTRAQTTFVQAAAAEPAAIAQIRALTADNPSQHARVVLLERDAARHIQLLGRSIARSQFDSAGAIAAFQADGSAELTRELRRLTGAMTAEEDALLPLRIAQQRGSVQRLFVVLAVLGVLMALVGIFSILIIRRYTQSLVESRDTVSHLNDELEQRVIDRTRDLSRANEEIQRFAYIVSHDLRSPLVNVMGFTGELEAATRPLAALVDAAEAEAPAILTEDARIAAREDLPEAIGFIRASTQKMDRLINAILRLSREGKRTLAPERLDLPALADGIVATLQHRLDEIGAEVTVDRAMPALVADRLAVEQMLSNLIENAVKYLKPGVPGRIRVSGDTEPGGRVAIAIADNGRGIDPRDHDRIFDLFRRSGAQDQPGEGIGLAHVRALAYRLGGLIDCTSALGEGATFRLVLPAEPISLPQGQVP